MVAKMNGVMAQVVPAGPTPLRRVGDVARGDVETRRGRMAEGVLLCEELSYITKSFLGAFLEFG